MKFWSRLLFAVAGLRSSLDGLFICRAGRGAESDADATPGNEGRDNSLRTSPPAPSRISASTTFSAPWV